MARPTIWRHFWLLPFGLPTVRSSDARLSLGHGAALVLRTTAHGELQSCPDNLDVRRTCPACKRRARRPAEDQRNLAAFVRPDESCTATTFHVRQQMAFLERAGIPSSAREPYAAFLTNRTQPLWIHWEDYVGSYLPSLHNLTFLQLGANVRQLVVPGMSAGDAQATAAQCSLFALGASWSCCCISPTRTNICPSHYCVPRPAVRLQHRPLRRLGRPAVRICLTLRLARRGARGRGQYLHRSV